MRKTLIQLFLILAVFPISQAVVINSADAQSSATSNCVITNIGGSSVTPGQVPANCQQGAAGGEPISSGSNTGNNIIDAGLDIEHAYYQNNNNGSTYDAAGQETYLVSYLSNLKDGSGNKKYNDAQISAFEFRRGQGLGAGCVQCLGYVDSVLGLVTGNQTDTGYGDPSQIPVVFTFNPLSLTEFGSGADADIRPGDIAASDGHIAIVYKLIPYDTTHFIGLQSNYGDGNPCRITDDYSVPKDGYRFYR